MIGALLSLAMIAGSASGSLMAWTAAVASRVLGTRLLPPVDDEPPPLPWATVTLGWAVLGVFVVAAVGMLLQSLMNLPQPAPVNVGRAVREVQQSLLLNCVIVAVLTGASLLSRCHPRQLGFRGDQLLRQVWDGVLGFFLAIGPVFALLILSQMGGLRGKDPEHDFLKLLQQMHTPEVWVWVGLAAVVSAPLTEELLFRVIVQTSIERGLWLIAPSRAATGMRTAVCVSVSSILFCAVHNFPDSLALIPLAIVLGFVYQRRRSYLSVVVIHGLFNGFNLLLLALGDQTLPQQGGLTSLPRLLPACCLSATR